MAADETMFAPRAGNSEAEGGSGPVVETGSLPGGAGVWADPGEERELSGWTEGESIPDEDQQLRGIGGESGRFWGGLWSGLGRVFVDGV